MIMKQYIYKAITLTLILTWTSHLIYSQELTKAPKQYSLELGYRYIISNDFVSSGGIHGYGFLLDYAWQLSGFTTAKHPVYLSVPIGYSFLPGGGSEPGQRMLSYGWTVRHMLNRDKAVQPFVGYALLLNQLSFENREGSIFGHQTRFSAGLNFRTESIITPFIKLEYSMARHPQLDVAESYWLHFIEMKLGLRLK